MYIKPTKFLTFHTKMKKIERKVFILNIINTSYIYLTIHIVQKLLYEFFKYKIVIYEIQRIYTYMYVQYVSVLNERC